MKKIVMPKSPEPTPIMVSVPPSRLTRLTAWLSFCRYADGLMKAIVSFLMLAVLCGCSSPHNAFIITNQTAVHTVSTNSYPSHTNQVFVTEESLPSSVKYELIGTIDVEKVWYGSSNNVKQSMADRARMIGADAVIDVKTWHQPSGWSWAAPHGSGNAVKIM